MDTTVFTEPLFEALGTKLPSVAAVLAILFVGWVLALLVRAGLRRALKAADLDGRLGKVASQPLQASEPIAVGAYYLILLVALVVAVGFLNIEIATEPLRALVTPIFGFLPSLLGAGVIGLVAWLLATVVKKVATGTLSATTLDERLEDAAGMSGASADIGTTAFWLVLILFAPAVLGALGLEGLLEPVQGLVATMLAALPNIAAAALIGGIGWLLAIGLSRLATRLLASSGLDKVGERAGLSEDTVPSELAGTLVKVLVFLPALIAALDALKIEAISGPATHMLEVLLTAVPLVIAAALILGLSWFVTRLVSPLVTTLVRQVGGDTLPEKLGLPNPETIEISVWAGRLTTAAIMLFAAMEAAARLGFGQLSEVVAGFVAFGGNLLVGGVIIAVGLAIANLAHRMVSQTSGPNASVLATIVRVAIIGLVLAMGLDAVGVAETVVTMAFSLTLGGVAVAFALAFGLGGREPAARLLTRWMDGADKPE